MRKYWPAHVPYWKPVREHAGDAVQRHSGVSSPWSWSSLHTGFKVVFPHQSAPHAGWEPDPLEVVRFLRMCPAASSLRYPDAKLPNVGTMKPKPPNSATFQGCNLPPLSTVSVSAFYWFPHCLSQWFSTFLTLRSFSAIPHIVVTPNNKIIFVATL